MTAKLFHCIDILSLYWDVWLPDRDLKMPDGTVRKAHEDDSVMPSRVIELAEFVSCELVTEERNVGRVLHPKAYMRVREHVVASLERQHPWLRELHLPDHLDLSKCDVDNMKGFIVNGLQNQIMEEALMTDLEEENLAEGLEVRPRNPVFGVKLQKWYEIRQDPLSLAADIPFRQGLH